MAALALGACSTTTTKDGKKCPSSCPMAKVAAYPVPDAIEDSPYQVRAGKLALPVERGGMHKPAYYVRFQACKPVRIRVKVDGPADEFDLKPERFRESMKIKGNTLEFDVADRTPRVLRVKRNGEYLQPLAILPDAPDCGTFQIPEGTVFDVRDYGVTGQGVETKAIQHALDACHENPGGGVVFFGPGIYTTGTVYVRNNTRVYLAPGALIQASSNPDDFPRHNDIKALMFFYESENSSLEGYGVLDGNGHHLRLKHDVRARVLGMVKSRDCRVENVVFRNSASWTFHMLGCDQVVVDGLKIIDDMAVPNTDGIDPDSTTNLLITNLFAYTGDDAIAIKTTHRGGITGPSTDITVRDSVIMCKKTCLKLGTESCSDMNNILFENIDIVNSSRALALWMRDGSDYRDVTYRNIRAHLIEYAGEHMSGEPVRITIEHREGIGTVKDILFEDIYFQHPYRVFFRGRPDSWIEDITFKNVVFEITPRTIKNDQVVPLFDTGYSRNIEMIDCRVKWLEDQKDLWAGMRVNTDEWMRKRLKRYTSPH
jgi:polygalacturonase